MTQPTLAIFANFLIDNEERFQRMKDSFNSFKDAKPNQWVVNIRGSYKDEAGDFLKKELGEKVSISYLQSKKGWAHDSNVILKKITTNYLLSWVEDQILIASPEALNSCVSEMNKYKVDQLWYSSFTFFTNKQFSVIKPEKIGDSITVQKIDFNACAKIRDEMKKYRTYKYLKDVYIVSLTSIMSKEFFKKILNSPKPCLKRWNMSLPFNFEKRSKDKVVPVIWHAVSKKELFVPIDDDANEPGYSLISRGLYPNRVSREEMKKIEFASKKLWMVVLIKITPKPIRKLGLFVKRIFWTLNI